jgi:hypothetical protein
MQPLYFNEYTATDRLGKPLWDKKNKPDTSGTA